MARCTWCKRKWKKCVEAPCVPAIVFRPRQNGKSTGGSVQGPSNDDDHVRVHGPEPKLWWCSCRDGYICPFHVLRMGQENLKNMKQDQRPVDSLRVGDDVPAVDYTNECHNDNHDPGCTCDWDAANPSLKEECDGSSNCPAAHHIEGCYSDVPVPKDGGDDEGYVESWVEEAQRIINGDRADAYGKPGPEDTTERIAKAWSAYLAHKLNADIDARDYCWMIGIMKAIRDTHQRKRDNPVDAHGYLILMEKHSE